MPHPLLSLLHVLTISSYLCRPTITALTERTSFFKRLCVETGDCGLLLLNGLLDPFYGPAIVSFQPTTHNHFHPCFGSSKSIRFLSSFSRLYLTMNRFRTKKKVKEDLITSARPSSEDQYSSSFKGFRKTKKTAEEEKKEDFDLENALPSSDNFRTSLLMTGLSARFSMLREQDDPNTKIGKASDDSVLFPRRQSRTLDGAFRGLDDIAEVESIRSPPFMRADSFISDTDSTNGSVMNRNRPGEGNVLFGGRQKIYRIPAGQTSKPGTGGGMGGRALYEDDVALSAFQKFKQREKDRLAQLDFDADRDEASDAAEAPLALPTPDAYDVSPFPRSDSPSPVGYNLRRETSSTTSSAARNSTAATSVVSQATTSIKDGPQSAAQTGSNTTIRARRLYEQGLNQDMHEHQSSALSRMDTLTGKRSFGQRTPDLAQSPSPTAFGFSGALNHSTSARHVLTRGSAPNLRSVSPPTTAPPAVPLSSTTSLDSPGLRSFSSAADAATRSTASPPLSPPISDSGDQLQLSIQPNDRGKATAMGVFQKPSLPYDESRFAQRQLQLQHGRDTPTEPTRTASNASHSTAVSRSSSVARNSQVGEQKSSQAAAPPVVAAPKGPFGPSVKERAKTFLFDADEEDSLPTKPTRKQSGVPVPISVQRPSDQDHPAFRQPAAASNPVSVAVPDEEPLDIVSRDLVVPLPSPNATEDSPTLGPGAGLSGLVRQHLRTNSNASSVYSFTGLQNNSYDTDPSYPSGQADSGGFHSLGMKGSTWNEQEWSSTDYNTKPLPTPTLPIPPTPQTKDVSKKDDEDDFASQLANARRRVQERLTTYVESDGSRVPSPLLAPTEPALPLPSAKANSLGILRGKSSRGSLLERNRDAKSTKLLGIGAATMSTTPSPSRQSFEEMPSAPGSFSLPPAAAAARSSSDRNQYNELSDAGTDADAGVNVDAEAEARNMPATSTAKDAAVHPGLRAFRSAKRQLQKQKEMEMDARHSEDGVAEAGPTLAANKRSPSQDQKLPPTYYQQRGPSPESWSSGGGPRSESKMSSQTERDRSGSETSNGGDSRSRPVPPRLRTPADGVQQGGHFGAPRSAGAVRSPGLPGTDIRHSPHMPPQMYAGNSMQKSPMGGMPSSPYYAGGGTDSPGGASGRTTPTAAGSRMLRPAAPSSNQSFTTSLNESMKKVIKKSEISEPTFLGSTGRVPTVSLSQSASAPEINGGSQSRSGSRNRGGSNTQPVGFVPPLPPINPLRKQSDARAPRGLGSFMKRRGREEGPADMSSASTSQLPLEASAGGNAAAGQSQQYGSSSDDEGSMTPQRPLRKQTSEASGMHYRKMEAGLPPSRMDLPGGMI